ncbi:hypothetical protein ACN6LC_004478 [Streptomyces violaceoruber]|uniref:hypothetical protein n=1 Tax=Streptomyces violaceoruber group TaxID=2867121 RepID=UPI0033FCF31F
MPPHQSARTLPTSARVDVDASVLEDIATNGYPSLETGVLWEDRAIVAISADLDLGTPVRDTLLGDCGDGVRAVYCFPVYLQFGRFSRLDRRAWHSAATERSATGDPLVSARPSV